MGCAFMGWAGLFLYMDSGLWAGWAFLGFEFNGYGRMGF